MGSGHILVYVFEVFLQLYEAEGESTRTAVEIILEKNIFGLDIDKRAFQLAYFSLMMKGRQYNRRFLTKKLQSNVYQVPDNFGISESELQLVHFNFPNQEKGHADLALILDTFKMSSDLGSLISFEGIDFENLNAGMLKQNVSFFDEELKQIIQVAELLQMKYTITVTNPPYMGASGFNPNLSNFSKLQFPDSKSDLFAMFIERWNNSIVKNGYSAMVTMQSWMFLSSYEKMREKIIANFTISNLMHMENMVMGIAFGTAVAIFFNNYVKGYKGTYHQIKTVDASQQKKPLTVPITGNRFNQISQDEFKKIPGSPISYWVSENVFNTYTKQTFDSKFKSAGRMKTHNNNKYIRYFWEVTCGDMVRERWMPYHNGGDFRKWFGNEDEVVDIREKAIQFYKKKGGFPNVTFIRELGITWNLITSATNSFRLKEKGYLYSSAAPTIINKTNQPELFYDAIGFLNSVVSRYLIQALNPTLNTTVGDVLSLPFVETNNKTRAHVENNTSISIKDWNSFETSLDFKVHPLI